MPPRLDPSKKQLKIWKQIWDIAVSDTFREIFTNTPMYDLDLSHSGQITSRKGTLYIPPEDGGDEGHFLGYEMNGNKILVFDPSGFGYEQFKNPRIIQSLQSRSNKILKTIDHHPQDILGCDGDTFCQTWSLGWLNTNLRRYVNSAKNQKTSIHAMWTIVTTISRSDKFRDFLHDPETKDIMNGVIQDAKEEFKIAESTSKINDVEQFLEFSKNITEDSIGKIITNDV